MKYFRIVSHIPELGWALGLPLVLLLFLLQAFGILHSQVIFLIFFVSVINIVIVCKMERVYLFSEQELTMYTQENDKSTQAMLDFYAAPGEEADFIDGLTSALLRPHPNTYRHRTLPREALRSYHIHQITNTLDLIVIDLAGCKERSGKRLVPYLLHNCRHVLCIFAPLGLSL